MALYENPGTNFHDLNLDWLIGKMKEVLLQWAATEADWAGVQAIINSLPASIDAYYSDPEHPREVPTAWTDQAQQLVDAAVQEEAQYREDEDDRLSGEMSEAIAQEVINRNNAITAAVGQAEQYADAAIAANNTSVVNPIIGDLSQEAQTREEMDTELDSRLDSVEAAIVGLQGAVRLDPYTTSGAIQGNYDRVYPGTMLDLANYTQSSSWRAAVYDAEPYEIFSLSWKVIASATDAVVFLDTNNVVLARINASYTGQIRLGRYVIAPPNTAKVLVQVNSASQNTRYMYRGMLSPYARLMFGGGSVPDAQTATALEFRYVRNDYTNVEQQINYPFETFQWVQAANRGADDTRSLQKNDVEDVIEQEKEQEPEEQTKTQK